MFTTVLSCWVVPLLPSVAEGAELVPGGQGNLMGVQGDVHYGVVEDHCLLPLPHSPQTARDLP